MAASSTVIDDVTK